jgi:zinc protease
VTAAPGRSLGEIDRVIADEIARLQAEGPTEDEMTRAFVQAEAHFVQRLQTVGGFGGKSDQLNAYNVFLGSPGFFDRDLARYRDATADRLRESARAHLPARARVALGVVPHGQAALGLSGSQLVARP